MATISSLTNVPTPALTDVLPESQGGTTYNITLQQVYNLFKTSFDSVYTALSGNADFYKYSISTSVASGNLTLSLLNYAGNTPTALAPVKIQIGSTVYTISSALTKTFNAGTNYFHLGDNEFATKEVDLFAYLLWDGSSIRIITSRIPYAVTQGDFDLTGSPWLNAKGYDGSGSGFATTNPVVNIGRFNAILSAGAGYTWSLPATSVIMNSPTFDTRELTIVPTQVWTGTPPSTPTTTACTYKINRGTCIVNYAQVWSVASSGTTLVTSTTPFSTTSAIVNANGWAGAGTTIKSGRAQMTSNTITLILTGNADNMQLNSVFPI